MSTKNMNLDNIIYMLYNPIPSKRKEVKQFEVQEVKKTLYIKTLLCSLDKIYSKKSLK